MGDFVFNIAKGRTAELYNRVQTNDSANAALVLVVLADTGLEADSTMRAHNTLSALLAGTSNEVTNTGYARKTLTDADLSAIAPDDANNRMDLDIPDQSWTTPAVGDDWAKLVICYDPDTTTSTDADLVPLTGHDFVTSPDGSSDVQAIIDTAGFYSAS